MSKIRWTISWTFLILSLSGCKYTGEKLTPIFPDFSKSTVNTYKTKSVEPLEFELVEQGLPFSEVEKRILNKDMEPLVCFPITQAQEMRREWEASKRKSKSNHTMGVYSDSEDHATRGARGNADY